MRRPYTKQPLTLVADSHPAPQEDRRAAIDVGDLSDLPAELLNELSISQIDVLERQIVAILQACGGTADLDQILIGLYRKFQIVQKRRFLQNKLWRMVRKGQIDKAKGARGIFRLEPSKPRHRRRRK